MLRFLAIWAVLLISLGQVWAATLEEGAFRVTYHESDRASAERAMDVLLEAAATWQERLPAGSEPIDVVLAHSHAEFKRLAGAYGQVDVGGIAKSEEGLIVMKSPQVLQGDFNGVLRHELIHVLIARNLNYSALPRWLNEGLAMHLSGEHRWSTTFHVARMHLDGTILSYPDLQLTLLAFPGELQFGDAYAQSLSMTRFLAEELGEEKLWSLLYDLDDMSFAGALEAHTGWKPYTFWQDWKRSLWLSTLVFTLITGISLFQIAALLLVLAWWRKRSRAQSILDEWEEGENEPLAPWEAGYDEPYLWEEDDDDEY